MISTSIYYHGSTVGELTELIPYASPHSNLNKAAVYLSLSKALSSIYIWSREYKWMTFNIRQDGAPVYTETHKGALQEFYDGVRGYIYICEGSYSTDNATGIKLAAVSYEPVPIKECETVENAYEKILSYAHSGDIIIRRYEDLTEREHDSNRKMILGAINRLNLLNGKHPLSPFVKSHFPELWKEAKFIDKNNNM